jgi:hypothetical protein
MGKPIASIVRTWFNDVQRCHKKFNGRLAYIRSLQNPLDDYELDELDISANALHIRRKRDFKKRCIRRFRTKAPKFFTEKVLNFEQCITSLKEYQECLKKFKVRAGLVQSMCLDRLYHAITYYESSWNSRYLCANQRMFLTNWSCDPRIELQGSLVKELCVNKLRNDLFKPGVKSKSKSKSRIFRSLRASTQRMQIVMFGKGAYRAYLRITPTSAQVIDT